MQPQHDYSTLHQEVVVTSDNLQRPNDSEDASTPPSPRGAPLPSPNSNKSDSSPDSVIATSTSESTTTTQPQAFLAAQIATNVSNDSQSFGSITTATTMAPTGECLSGNIDTFVSSSIDVDIDDEDNDDDQSDTISRIVESSSSIISCDVTSLSNSPSSSSQSCSSQSIDECNSMNLVAKCDKSDEDSDINNLLQCSSSHVSTQSYSWSLAGGSTSTATFSIPPPTINDLISQSFINPEMACDSVLDSLDGSGSGSDLDSDDSNGTKCMDKNGKQRLPLEDFMRKIVFQINSTSGKILFWEKYGNLSELYLTNCLLFFPQ